MSWKLEPPLPSGGSLAGAWGVLELAAEVEDVVEDEAEGCPVPAPELLDVDELVVEVLLEAVEAEAEEDEVVAWLGGSL